MSRQSYVNPESKPTSPGTALYLALMLAAGSAILIRGMSQWHTQDWGRYIAYWSIALIASGMKVSLPAIPGTISMNFLFVLIGISQLSRAETLAMGCVGILVQSVFHSKSGPRAIQLLFNVASMACSIEASYDVYHSPLLQSGSLEAPLRLLLAAGVFFVTNTLSIAVVIALTEAKNAWAVWRDSYFWSFPNYLVGAAVAWAVGAASLTLGWQTSLLLLPILYVIYRSAALYVNRLEDEKQRAEQQRVHAEEVAALHRRTIETLALAIEAKDQTTGDHLARVEIYAIAVGEELGLSANELDALRAAALLHDIGKLAVPEYIISKPGKLTPEEFERMKTHTIVGAEIVERIRFPYPVAPIVRSHHEKWNGTGYPDGLSGEQIPIGARVLSAVDCLDALASDRQYRRALPLNEAIQVVQEEAGKSFDPRVVQILARRYIELERKAKSCVQRDPVKLSTSVRIERGDAPAAGFETAASSSATRDLVNFQRSLEHVEQQARLVANLTQAVARNEDREAVVAILRGSLREVVPYDAMVVYLRNHEHLVPAGSDCGEYRLLGSLKIPLGMGLSGWVAETGKAIVNGNPSVEPGYLDDPTLFSTLGSALSVPLENKNGIIGVLSLYRQGRDAFSSEEQTSLLACAPALARALDVAVAKV